MRCHGVLLWQKEGLPGDNTTTQSSSWDKVDEPVLRNLGALIRDFRLNRVIMYVLWLRRNEHLDQDGT